MIAILLATTLPLLPLQEDEAPGRPELTADELAAAGRVAGLEFTDEELEQMLSGAREHLETYERLWELSLDNSVAPVLSFSPTLEAVAARHPHPRSIVVDGKGGHPPVASTRPDDLEELALADIPTLAHLIRTREVSCLELTDMYLARLERLDAQLECVVTLLPERARAQAAALDAELAAGKWRGPLHGIPWGAKDLLAVAGAPTTWGAAPYVGQTLDLDAAVVERLDAAGAVLIAKLTLGALAMGDVWFDGRTRNPWNPRQGSSGSSAGPAAATAAGGVVFAIGSETLGSILSPSARCGNSSLRPTFGRVSRHGAMALSWSMDKLGPMCRSLDDAAIVFAAIAGRDVRDDDTIERPAFDPGHALVTGLVVGLVEGSFRDEDEELELLAELEQLGCEVVTVSLPDLPSGDLTFLLSVEAAAAFDELTRSGRDDQLVRQMPGAWPNIFRTARLVPAVEYLRALRLRRALVEEVEKVFDEVDVIMHPTRSHLGTFNLSGHPSVCAPWKLRDDGTPRSVAFTAGLYRDEVLLALAAAWQRSTQHHELHPELARAASGR